MKNSSESIEMYLETIYILESDHGHAHGVDIANKLGVSKPGVTKAINNLKLKGFVNTEKYGTITLTEKGIKKSKEIYFRHKLIKLFLENSLKLSKEQAAKDACKMEHVLSVETLEAMKMYLENNNINIEELKE